MQTTIDLTANGESAVEYVDGVTEQATPISAKDAAALPKRVRNFRKASEPTADLAGWLIERKARRRAVRISGDGTKTVSRASGAIVTTISAVTVSAETAANLAGLNAAETAAFLARFPKDGSEPAAPKDAATVAAAFRKVNALRGKRVGWTVGTAATEVLA